MFGVFFRKCHTAFQPNQVFMNVFRNSDCLLPFNSALMESILPSGKEIAVVYQLYPPPHPHPSLRG